jgi:hydrogenase maturation factor
MCTGYPAQVTGLGADETVMVSAYGRPVRVTTIALDEPLAEGDWVLVYAGIALARLDESDALERKRIIEQTTGEEP